VTLAARRAVAAAIVACALAGAVDVLVMDRLGPAAGLGLPLGAAAAVAVWWRPILGVQMALLAVPLDFFAVRLGGESGLSLTEALLLLTAGVTLLHWAVLGERVPVPRTLVPLIALCVIVGLGYLAAEDKTVVAKILLMWSAFTVVGVLVARSSPRDVRAVLACLAVAGGLVGWMAVAGGTEQTLVAGGTIATGRAQASFSQPNTLGFFLTLAIPVAAVLAVQSRGLARLAAGLLTVGAVWGLALSLSRTSLVGTALALGVLLLLPAFRRVAFVALAGLAVFALFNMQALQESRQISVVTERLATIGRQTETQRDPRIDIYRTTPSIIAANPLLGVGAGNFSLAAKRYALLDPEDTPYDHAHDVPLTIGAELGIPALLVLAWFWAAIAGAVMRAIRRRGDPAVGALLLAIVAALVGIVVPSLGDYPPRTNAIAATFIVLVGALAALLRSADQARSS
jgi:O-antigen ligase